MLGEESRPLSVGRGELALSHCNLQSVELGGDIEHCDLSFSAPFVLGGRIAACGKGILVAENSSICCGRNGSSLREEEEDDNWRQGRIRANAERNNEMFVELLMGGKRKGEGEFKCTIIQGTSADSRLSSISSPSSVIPPSQSGNWTGSLI